MKKYLNEDGLLYLVQKIKTWLSGKVDKVDGKGLSTNDYTTTEKNKLANIAAGANKTTVENSLTSTSTTNALSAAQGKVLDEKIKAINTGMEDLGAGDMLKSVYDTNNNGKVDDADKLGGQLPSYYAKAADLEGVDKIATQANSSVQNLSQEMQYFGESLGDMESLNTNSDDIVGAINEVNNSVPNHVKTITTNDISKWNTKDIPTLTSPVRIYNLATGVYKVPSSCVIQYDGADGTRTFTISGDGVLIVQTTADDYKTYMLAGGMSSNSKPFIYTGIAYYALGSYSEFEFNDYATSAELTTGLNKKANTSDIPTNNNQLTNGAGYQTAAQVNQIIQNVIGAAPDALNTLDELAQALGDDPNFAATITEELSKKVNSADLIAITNAEIDTIVATN